MSIGEGIGQGLMFLANQVASSKRADKEQKQQLAMFNMRRQAELEDMQKQNELKRQWQIEDRNTEYDANLNANEAALGLAGAPIPEGFDKTKLKYLAPNQLNSVLDDVRNTASKKEQAELKKQQAAYANKIYQNVLSGGPLDPNLLAEAEQAGVDTTKAFSLYQGRLDKQSLQEDRQLAAREMKQIQQENAKALKYLGASLRESKSGGGGRGGSGGSGGGFKQTRDGSFVKVDKRGNPTGKIYSAKEAYNLGITNTPPPQRVRAMGGGAKAPIPVPKISL